MVAGAALLIVIGAIVFFSIGSMSEGDSEVCFIGPFIGIILIILGIVIGIAGLAASPPRDDYPPQRYEPYQQQQQPIIVQTPAKESQGPIRVCLKCGFQIDADSKFCKHCGNQLI